MLQQRLQDHQKLQKYNQLVFAAVSEREPLQDVNVITLKGAFAQKVEHQAIERILSKNKQLSNATLMAAVTKVFESNHIVVQEAVYHTETGISVVVNAETIDDQATTRILELIQDALYQLDGRHGTIKFGEPVSFTRGEINWLNHH